MEMFSIVMMVFSFRVKILCLHFIKDNVFKEILVCFCPNGSNLRLQTGGAHFASISAAVRYSADTCHAKIFGLICPS
jgi:hypothetical protein